MKPRGLAALLLGLAVLGACRGPAGPQADGPGADTLAAGLPGAPEHVVLVSIAGLPALDGTDAALEAAMPTLRAMAREGVVAREVEAVAPPSVYPVHATYVTGRRPAEHGIPADHMLGERSVRSARHWHASRLEGPSLFEAAQEGGISVAAFDWPVTGGANLRWLLPDQRPGRSDESFGDVLEDAATPWVVEYVREHASPSLLAGDGAPGPELDALLVGAACTLLEQPEAPGFTLLRLAETEAPLLEDGPGAPAALAAFAASDQHLARLLACSARGGGAGRTAFVVVGDRQFSDVHTALQVNALFVEEGLLAPTGGATWRAIVRSNGGSAFVYARGAEEAVMARRLLEAEALRTGAFRLVGAEEMISLGADRDAWFGLAAAPGYVFRDGFAPPTLRPAEERGDGGYLEPLAEAPGPGFVAWGRGVRAGVVVPVMGQTDVAPTLAYLLGVPLPDAYGRPLVGVFDFGR